MAYTASTLITKSYYLSGIVARGLQVVDGQQLSDGLSALNSVLQMGYLDPDLIPYYTIHNLNAIAGQETYFIENLLLVDTFTFNNQTVRYATTNRSRTMYFGTSRANNINSLPFSFHFEPAFGGGNIYLYPIPNNTYQLTIVGKFGLTDVIFDTDLSLIYDRSYIDYLSYVLAYRLCNENGISLAPQTYQQLKIYEAGILNKAPIDLTLNKISALGKVRGVNYGYANLGTGYFPS